MNVPARTHVRTLVHDAFRSPEPTAMRKFTAEPIAEHTWRISYDMQCFEGASCENPGHEGKFVAGIEVTDDELAAEGVTLRDGRLIPLSFDELLIRSPLVRACNELAERAHDGQKRKHGPPYIVHPRAVARRLWDSLQNADTELIAAALLHDVLEDTDVTAEQIESLAGARVRNLVEAVTKPQNVLKPDYLVTLQGKSADAKALKLADRTENLLDLVQHPDPSFGHRYLKQTKDYILPLATYAPVRLREGLLAALNEAERFVDRSS